MYLMLHSLYEDISTTHTDLRHWYINMCIKVLHAASICLDQVVENRPRKCEVSGCRSRLLIDWHVF